jgi:putative DNA primase/helicase
MTNNQNNESPFKDEPWHESVNAAALIKDIQICISRFVILKEEEALAISLWVIHTYFIKAAHEPQIFEHTPYLQISSPEKKCGKSTLRECIGELVARPLTVMGASSASLYRVISSRLPTLLIDEADTFLRNKPDIDQILTSGYKQDGIIIRQGGKTYEETKEFSTWCAKLIAGIGSLTDTVESRCIVVRLRRKLKHESVERKNYVLSKYPNYFVELRRKIVRFVVDYESLITIQNITLPDELDDRTQDNWRGLLKIANFCGEDIGCQTLKAALSLHTTDMEESTDSIELLRDLKQIIEQSSSIHISSTDLISNLKGMEHRPWSTFGKDGLNAYQLSKKLKPFGIFPGQSKHGSIPVRGYFVSELKEVIDRYV